MGVRIGVVESGKCWVVVACGVAGYAIGLNETAVSGTGTGAGGGLGDEGG